MKALTLWQPWATGMARGLKTIETRSWATKHRGLLAIHASTRIEVADRRRLLPDDGCALPVGAVVAIVNVLDCVEMTGHSIFHTTPAEVAWGDYKPGRFAWMTELVLVLDPPRAARGRQQLWNWTVPTDVEVALTERGHST